MIRVLSDQNRIQRLYYLPRESIYSHRFFEDLCSGYAYNLGERKKEGAFLYFNPSDCKVAKLLKNEYYYDMSYSLEKLIDEVIYCLIAFGKAYVYIVPEYMLSKEENKSVTKVLASIELREIKGFLKKKNHDKILFCSKGFDGTISEIEMLNKQLIIFDIKDLGYRKRYFVNILRKLSKYDITLSSTRLVEENLDGYDISVHLKRHRILEMKASKDIGWLFRTDELSDSYILYRRILTDKLRLRFLTYCLDRINSGLETFFDNIDGKLMAHIKEKNYDQLWKDYSDGKLTGTELSNCIWQ